MSTMNQALEQGSEDTLDNVGGPLLSMSLNVSCRVVLLYPVHAVPSIWDVLPIFLHLANFYTYLP